MNIEEMRMRKKELGYTNAMIAEKTGLSIGAVQKFFSGETSSPRYDTIQKLEKLLKENAGEVREQAFSYHVASGSSPVSPIKTDKKRWPRQGEYTLEDYYSLPDEVRVELIDGVIYDMTAPTKAHQTIAFRICMQLTECIDANDMPCVAYIAPVDVRLNKDAKTVVQPDVVLLCHDDGSDKRIEGAPEMVVEVLSPSTRSKDCLIKLNMYMTAGVREYWIVDPDEEKVFVYDFENELILKQYGFTDKVPVGLSKGKCEIDFGKIRKLLGR